MAQLLAQPTVHVDETSLRVAERDLRMSKVKQKISGCFHSSQYAEAYCRTISLSSAGQQDLGRARSPRELEPQQGPVGSRWMVGPARSVVSVPLDHEHASGGSSRLQHPETGGVPLNDVCYNNPVGCGWCRRDLARLAERIEIDLPRRLPVRQYVLAVPKRLRWYLEREPRVITAVLHILLRVIDGLLRPAAVARPSTRPRARPHRAQRQPRRCMLTAPCTLANLIFASY